MRLARLLQRERERERERELLSIIIELFIWHISQQRDAIHAIFCLICSNLIPCQILTSDKLKQTTNRLILIAS